MTRRRSSPSASANVFAAMSQCPRAFDFSDQPYYTAIVFPNVRINCPVSWSGPLSRREILVPARPKKIFFREGTPESASPCRLFCRRNQSAFAPHGAILKQRCAVQRRNDHSKVPDHASRQAPKAKENGRESALLR